MEKPLIISYNIEMNGKEVSKVLHDYERLVTMFGEKDRYLIFYLLPDWGTYDTFEIVFGKNYDREDIYTANEEKARKEFKEWLSGIDKNCNSDD